VLLSTAGSFVVCGFQPRGGAQIKDNPDPKRWTKTNAARVVGCARANFALSMCIVLDGSENMLTDVSFWRGWRG